MCFENKLSGNMIFFTCSPLPEEQECFRVLPKNGTHVAVKGASKNMSRSSGNEHLLAAIAGDPLGSSHNFI